MTAVFIQSFGTRTQATKLVRLAQLAQLAICAAALASPVLVQAASAQVWRCEQAGRTTYANEPCAQGLRSRELQTMEPAKASDLAQARARVQQEQRGYELARREREGQEARELRQMQTQVVSLGSRPTAKAQAMREPTLAQLLAAQQRRSTKKAVRLSRVPAGETWRAVAPRSPRKRG